MDSEKRDDQELTEVELAIINLVADGKSNREIAKELSCSVDTIRTYMKYIFRKLKEKSRKQIAEKYSKIDPEEE